MRMNPAQRVPGTHFQRAIRVFKERDSAGQVVDVVLPTDRAGTRKYRSEPRDPSREVVAAKLSCGHWIDYAKKTSGHSKRTSAPCYAGCGASRRKEFEARRRDGWLRFAIERAVHSPARMEALQHLIHNALIIPTMPPRGVDAEKLWEELVKDAMTAGFYDRRDGQIDAD
jgi:hypothetical protein